MVNPRKPRVSDILNASHKLVYIHYIYFPLAHPPCGKPPRWCAFPSCSRVAPPPFPLGEADNGTPRRHPRVPWSDDAADACGVSHGKHRPDRRLP